MGKKLETIKEVETGRPLLYSNSITLVILRAHKRHETRLSDCEFILETDVLKNNVVIKKEINKIHGP